jgi:hypothetical protein
MNPRIAFAATVFAVAALAPATNAAAASSKACEGGAFAITLGDGSVVRGDQKNTSIAAGRLGATLQVRGRYIEFTVDTASFGIRNYTFTGAPSQRDMTGGRRIVAYAAKTPDHRGLTLSSAMSVTLDKEGLEIGRTGTGLSMKLQAQDCASGGLFQMEPERADGTATRITHTLGPDVFYFDNPNFRAREGDVLPFKDTTVTVAARINFASDRSSKFVGRDSPQVATRVDSGPTHPCLNTIPAPRRPGGTATVDHCGGQSVWDVASGGRMGGVFGEDAVEVAPPSSTCTHKCQAQDQVQGAAVVLGFPFPVPTANRLFPRLPTT